MSICELYICDICDKIRNVSAGKPTTISNGETTCPECYGIITCKEVD